MQRAATMNAAFSVIDKSFTAASLIFFENMPFSPVFHLEFKATITTTEKRTEPKDGTARTTAKKGKS
jgi:hypothetical protein